MKATSDSRPRLFYGRFVVTGGFTVTFVGFGCVYSFSAFIDPLQHDFGASRGEIDFDQIYDGAGKIEAAA